MRFFWILLCLLSSSLAFSEEVTDSTETPQETTPYLSAFKDRLVAVVDKSPITEKELKRYFEFYQQVRPEYKGKTYENMRASLIDELCMERVYDLLWASVARGNTIPVPEEQIAAFRSSHPDLICDDATIKNMFVMSTKRDQLVRHMLYNKITITQQELAAATKQPQIWQGLQSYWSFDIAYSDQPLTENRAASTAKNLKNYPIARLSPALLQAVDWSKMHSWQFFDQDGEYVAFRINRIQIASLLPYIYNIKLIPSEIFGAAPRAAISLKITSPHDLPKEFWSLIDPLSPGEVSEGTALLNGKAYRVELISNSEYPSAAMIEEQLMETLKNYRAQEKLPLWAAEMKNKFFIKVFPA